MRACGSPGSREAAAREMAEAIGLFFSLVLQAFVAYVAKESFAALLSKLRVTRYGSRFVGYLSNYFVELELDSWMQRLGKSTAAPSR